MNWWLYLLEIFVRGEIVVYDIENSRMVEKGKVRNIVKDVISIKWMLCIVIRLGGKYFIFSKI